MFKFHALDSTAEIAVVAFSNEAKKFDDTVHVRIEQYFVKILTILSWFKVNGTYELKNFMVKEEHPNYRSKTGNNFEISLGKDTILNEIDDAGVPQVPFNFRALDVVKQMSVSQSVGKGIIKTLTLFKSIKLPEFGFTPDLIGVLVEVYDLENTGKSTKRDLMLTDETKKSLIVTVWGKAAEEFAAEINSVVAIRRGSTSQFMGLSSVNIFSGTLFWVSPHENSQFQST